MRGRAILAEDDLRLIDVETFPVGNDRQFIAAFRAGNDGYVVYSVNGYHKFVQIAEANAALGLRMVDVHVEE